WLLDNSPEHRDNRNGQRLVDVSDLPENPEISDVACGEGCIEVAWATTGTRARFSKQWLEEWCNCSRHLFSSAPRVPGLTLRRAQDSVRFCVMDYREVCESTSARILWLRAAATWGIALLRGVGSEEGAILRAASLAGWVRETNYGRVFDVVVTPRP